MADSSWRPGRHAPEHDHGSPRKPTIAGHELHFDSSCSEELADLGGVLNDVQRDAADNHSVQHAVVSMGVRKWPGRRVLGERLEGSAHPPAAVVDVIEEFGLGEHTVGKGEVFSSKGCGGSHGSNSAVRS